MPIDSENFAKDILRVQAHADALFAEKAMLNQRLTAVQIQLEAIEMLGKYPSTPGQLAAHKKE